jgi:lauroyl/myristoyl acyltransferase
MKTQMAVEITSDLGDALDAARRPLQRRRSAPAGPRMRLRTTPWLRRMVPLRIAVARAEARGRALWERDPEARQRALAAIEAIVAGTARAGEVTALARQHLIETEVYEVMFWRPWIVPAIDAASDERLRRTLARDGGVLISVCHLGTMFLSMARVLALGHTPYSVVAPWLFESAGSGDWDRRLDRWWTAIRARDERLVPSVGSFPVLQALLEQGEVVQLFFDMPGGGETRFLGKPVMLATGSARLAVQAGVPIVPMRARRDGHRMHADVGEPLDPSEFASVEDLHQALAAVHERWILEVPASLEDPRRPGAWELGATATGWSRPGSA